MKICNGCKIEKHSGEFGKRGEKLRSRCRACETEYTKSWMLKNTEKRKAYEKEYRKTDKRKAVRKRRYEKEKSIDPDFQVKLYWSNEKLREKKIENVANWRKKNPNKAREYSQAMRLKYPEKNRARMDLRNAILRGEIVRPQTCSKCGDKASRIEGHHEDYSKPFDVVWLCPPCHRKLHKEL